MSFATTPEQDALVSVARQFGRERLAPYYKQREREGAFDRPTLREMGKLGFLGVELAEEHGGLGLDCVTAGLVLEALCESDYNVGQLTVSVCWPAPSWRATVPPTSSGRAPRRREGDRPAESRAARHLTRHPPG